MSRSSLNGSSTCRSAAPCGRLALALVLTGITALATGTEALDVERSFTQYLRERWDAASGFPGGPVYAIAQSSDGYLWIGAEKGLVRFDGVTFRLFDPGSAVGASRATLGVVAAPDGSLWARVRGAALFRYHAGAFQNILPDVGPPESVVSALLRGREDAILLATLGRGALAYRGGKFTAIATTSMLPSSSFVISMAEAPNGDIWLGTRDAGLLRVEGDRVTRLTGGLPSLKINCLLAGHDGEIWIGTDGGIVKWNGTAITNCRAPGGPATDDGAAHDSGSRVERLDCRRAARARACERRGRRAIDGGEGVVPGPRRDGLRRSRWKSVGGRRAWARTLARSDLHDLLRRAKASPAMPSDRFTRTSQGESGSDRRVAGCSSSVTGS